MGLTQICTWGRCSKTDDNVKSLYEMVKSAKSERVRNNQAKSVESK